ncbi:MAG: TolC family protein [Rhodocyclales bacterium]|nr:TolC family protein [Rhodocyclales bacterium]
MRLLIALLLAALPVAAHADAPLTEAAALRLGLARPELAERARDALDEAEANADEAGLWANPTLELGRERMNAAPGSTERSWQISQPLDLGGRRGLRREAGERRTDAVRAGNEGRRHEQAAEIRRAFHAALHRQAVVDVTVTWVQRFARVDAKFARLEKAGEASGYDRRRLARERLTAEARLAAGRGELARERERLAALIGRAEARDAALTGSLLPAAPPALADALARLDTRPDLTALGHQAEAAELEQRAAGRGWLPDLTLGVGGKRTETGIARDHGTLLTLSIPLPVFDRQQTADRRAAAQALNARAKRSLARSRAEGELRGLHGQLGHLIAAATDYRRQAAAGASELLRIAEAAYQGGESTLLELLDAYRGALETETTALDLEWKAREARIDYDLLTGSIAE